MVDEYARGEQCRILWYGYSEPADQQVREHEHDRAVHEEVGHLRKRGHVRGVQHVAGDSRFPLATNDLRDSRLQRTHKCA